MAEIPAQPESPPVNSFAFRLWPCIPMAYRDYDAGLNYPLLTYLDALTRLPGEIHEVIERIAGSRPAGPAAPEPWGLDPSRLDSWRAARVERASALGDPLTADAAWLPWLAQLVGARIDRTADDATRRAAVRYAYAGWRAGTRSSIEHAARTVLTGSQYARVVPFTRSDGAPATPWDVAIVVRQSEAPDAAIILAAVERAGVKPAGVVLWVRYAEASWDQIEATRPVWSLWEADDRGSVDWDRLTEAPLTYADVPGNLISNASYETGLTGWAAGANTGQSPGTGGLDGLAYARLTATGAGQVNQASTAAFAVTGSHDYRVSVSLNPAAARTARIRVTFNVGGTLAGPDTAASHTGSWTNRLVAVLTAPIGATTATAGLQADGLGAGEVLGVDAWDAREYTG
jgi:hypothetical protein